MTNYYAIFDDSLEKDALPNFHIGNVSTRSLLVSGIHFKSYADMKNHLLQHEKMMDVYDNEKRAFDVKTVLNSFESSTTEVRSHHYHYLSKDPLTRHQVKNEPSDETGMAWLDAEGFFLYNGWFA